QRTVFLQHGFAFWNNFWYAGRYSFVTYSLIYYPLAALVGIKLLAVATVATAALAFAMILGREWGPVARWSSWTFAIVWAGIVLSAAFPFALGACLEAFGSPSSIGENVARLRYVAVPVAVLSLSLRRGRPLPVAVVALGLAVSWNVTPLAFSFVKTAADPASSAAYWQPAIVYL